jgi:hypothetical protein
MKSNELRIGNFVYLTDKEKVWEILDGYEIDKCEENPFTQPIPLKEEWLLKFGFKTLCKDWQKKGIIIHTRKRGYVLRKSVPVIQYVHQLQNLYFALTGEELTYKDNK